MQFLKRPHLGVKGKTCDRVEILMFVVGAKEGSEGKEQLNFFDFLRRPVFLILSEDLQERHLFLLSINNIMKLYNRSRWIASLSVPNFAIFFLL